MNLKRLAPSALVLLSHTQTGHSSGVSWTEPYSWQTARCSLSVSQGKKLHIKLSVNQDGLLWDSTREDAIPNDTAAEWRLVLPIRVERAKRPQVLAKLYRSNWLDFAIYKIGGTLDDSNIAKSFSFSCRDEKAIRWHAKNGALISLETFDRYEKVPEKLQRERRPFHSWQLVSSYKFDKLKDKWVLLSRNWQEYKGGEALPGQSIKTLKDCSFRF